MFLRCYSVLFNSDNLKNSKIGNGVGIFGREDTTTFNDLLQEKPTNELLKKLFWRLRHEATEKYLSQTEKCSHFERHKGTFSSMSNNLKENPDSKTLHRSRSEPSRVEHHHCNLVSFYVSDNRNFLK